MRTCSLCGQSVDTVVHISEDATLKLIQDMNPQWVSRDGGCPKCLDYYQNLDKRINLISDY